MAGVEIEYWGTLGSARSAKQSTSGGMIINFIVKPMTIGNQQVFFVAGPIGMLVEKFGNERGAGVMNASDIGGGIIRQVVTGVRLRLDYRLFFLAKYDDVAPSTKHPQRLSAGLSVGF
jgi:hypothetical protein